jgi:hypothetical protein
MVLAVLCFCLSSLLAFPACVLILLLVDLNVAYCCSLSAARAPWAVPEHLLHAQQRHEVPAKLLQEGAAGEAVLPVSSELLVLCHRRVASTFIQFDQPVL